MKHKLELHYSVQNGGDGSAYPKFMSSKELAEYDQEHMDEGWGEPCTGSITLESESPITIKEDIETPEGYLVNLICNDSNQVDKFIQKFFPDGKPQFKVQLREVRNQKKDYKYIYNDVFVNGHLVDKVFRVKEKSGQPFEDFLNSK